ncbi:hypothetical protein F5Y10DRAFT_251962 [Nemania abortiva]|nr:hypothetical protein F5Y10DRAFT_251962 [Nemania abortiva]
MESSPTTKETPDRSRVAKIADEEPLDESYRRGKSSPVSKRPDDSPRGQTLGQTQITPPKPRRSRSFSLSIQCPATGASHSHLLIFGIQVCPRCHLDIYKNDTEKIDTTKEIPLTADHASQSQSLEDRLDREPNILTHVEQINKHLVWLKKIVKRNMSESEDESDNEETTDNAPDESRHNIRDLPEDSEGVTTASRGMAKAGDDTDTRKWEHMSQPSVMEKVGVTGRDAGIFHEIEFQDAGEAFLQRRPWQGPFNLADNLARTETLSRKTIARITTILVTSVPSDQSRSEKERLRIAKAGFLHNPRIEFNHIKQEMSVRSKQLIEVLRSIVHYYPSINLRGEVLTLDSPYCLLAHHLVELENFKNDLETNNGLAMVKEEPVGPKSWVMGSAKDAQITVDHIEKLLHFMKTNLFGSQMEAEKARHLQDPPVCTFTMMWLLYKPGTTVYVKDAAGKARAYVIERIVVDDTVSAVLERSQPYTVYLWNLDSDGKYVRRAGRIVLIGVFDGARPIMDLKIVPAAFIDASDKHKTRQALIQKGRKWFKMLTGAQQWHYSGQTARLANKTVDTRVVIDVKQQFNRASQKLLPVEDMGEDLAICPCEKCLGRRPHPPKGFPWAEYDMIDPEHDDLELPDGYEDKDHRYLLCSGVLMGFALKSRTWEILDVEHCRPATINVNAINTLVMPDERKRMIKAIVQKYIDPIFMPGRSAQTWGADFIEAKGEGQIFLLHGGPGVGKTYTAECISELIGRPLLSLTCADFGTDEEVMEGRLLSWFKLAESWGAVMVLDEADVWLERRMVADLKRNTLVAVFLRCLEYYRGILFLTSNRVGTFDDAFISRIHLVIYYEDLGEPQRKQIWKQFFDKLERERKDDIIVESRAKHFVLNDSEMRMIPWNGREIRNVFQTAVSLAEYRFHFEGGKMESDKIMLDKVDFEQVCQMSVDFKKYLTKVHKGDDENDRAMRDRTRA